MTLWQGMLLGLVQGLTEFLPVSSSGHLALVEALTGVKTPGVFVEVMLHVATLGSVLLVYGPRLARIAVGALRGQPEDLRYVGYLVLGTIPAGIIGVLLHRVLEERFHTLLYVGIGFFLTGILLWSTRRRHGTRLRPTAGTASIVGLGQASAVLLHMSRSGSTVSAGRPRNSAFSSRFRRSSARR
jgi:undecaprenyl-diphosphatase